MPSSGTWFQVLQATSHALHPMHTLVSVKNPIRGGCSTSYPASCCTSSSRPYNELLTRRSPHEPDHHRGRYRPLRGDGTPRRTAGGPCHVGGVPAGCRRSRPCPG